MASSRGERFRMRETQLESPPAAPAFADLIERFQWPLYNFIRGMVGDDEQARDAVQDVFCDAWRATLRGTAPFAEPCEEDGIRRWLFHTAYCRAVSVLRRRRLVRWESLDVATIDDTGDEMLALTPFEDQLVEGEVMRAALARLSPDDVACLLLNTLEGYTAAQIAQIVGIAPEAAKKRLARAKERLRVAYARQNRPS